MVPIFIRTFYPQTFCSPNISIALSWKVESSECFALDTFLSERQSSCSLITINFLFFILSDGSGTKFELFPRRLAIGMPPQWNEWKENEIFWSALFFSTLISKSPRDGTLTKLEFRVLGERSEISYLSFSDKKVFLTVSYRGQFLTENTNGELKGMTSELRRILYFFVL